MAEIGRLISVALDGGLFAGAATRRPTPGLSGASRAQGGGDDFGGPFGRSLNDYFWQPHNY